MARHLVVFGVLPHQGHAQAPFCLQSHRLVVGVATNRGDLESPDDEVSCRPRLENQAG